MNIRSEWKSTMRSIFALLVLVATAVALGKATSEQETTSSAKQAANAPTRLIVYYFHGYVRCINCVNFEKYTDELLRTKYADALKNGQIEWKVVNVDEPANEHFIDDYKLFTKSLVLVRMKNDKQETYKNLTGIWQVAGNKEKFQEYVRKEIEAMLQGGGK